MANVTASIDVRVPIDTVYNQWTQFELFPQFMEGVKDVRQVDDRRLEWVADVGGKEERWEAEITEQEPDQVIAWRSISGQPNGGRVTFTPTGADSTRVQLDLQAEPQGAVEQAGVSLGVLDRQVKDDLKRFRDFIETRQTETGAWRGSIDGNG